MDVTDLTRYELGRVLGKGTFGLVYEVTDVTTEQKYAMKIIDKNHRSYYRTKDEVAIQSIFDHPNIVKIEKSFETNDKIVIIMELCGNDLFQTIDLKGMPADEALNIFLQTVSAVAYIHSQGYAHRDIKSLNIIDCDGTWKLIDFGYAAKADTVLTSLCCTVLYAAPEAVFADEHNPYLGQPTDVWALGILLYELLYGKTPFMKRDAQKTLNSIFSDPIVVPFDSKIPKGLRDLIVKMLDKNPKKRVDINYVMDATFREFEKMNE